MDFNVVILVNLANKVSNFKVLLPLVLSLPLTNIVDGSDGITAS